MMYKTVSRLFLLPVILAGGVHAQFWSMGYYAPWGTTIAPASSIDMTAFTHVIHVQANVTQSCGVDVTTNLLPQDGPTLISAAHAVGGKVLMAIGQRYYAPYRERYLSTCGPKAAFADAVVAAMNQYGYDGIDVDWEPLDATNIKPFMLNLRARLAPGQLLSADAAVSDSSFWGPFMAANPSALDRVNVMTYDLVYGDSQSWFNTALYTDNNGTSDWSVELARQRFVAAGAIQSKMNIGMGFYGYSYPCPAPRNKSCTTPNGNQIWYYDLANILLSKTYRYDTLAKVPYVYDTTSYWTYDDSSSIADKIGYVKTKILGGWGVWQLSGDYVGGRHVLVPTIKAASQSSSGPVTSIVVAGGDSQSAVVNSSFANPLTATLTDSSGRPVYGAYVTFTPPSTGASGVFLGSSTVVSNGLGVAMSPIFTANGTAGSYTVSASVGGGSLPVTPVTFNLTNIPGPSIAASTGSGQYVAAGGTFSSPLVALVTDGSGQPIPNVTVTFKPPSTGASCTFSGSATAITTSSGSATSTPCTANRTTGTYSVVATANGVPGQTAFTLTNTGNPTIIIPVSGASQPKPFTQPLVAQVRDNTGTGVPGASVTFKAPTSGASCTFNGSTSITVTTDGRGYATSPIPVSNGTAGSYTVTASTPVVPRPANFSMTN